MAFSELEARRVEKATDAYIQQRRPPPDIRPELDIGFRITAQSVEIFEVRPVWRGAPGEKMENPVAKATYIKSRELWKVYWMRADLKWHSYAPTPSVGTLTGFFELVESDPHACFWG